MVARVVMRSGVFAAAIALDIVIGDPQWLPHPVRAIGAVVNACDRLARDLTMREHQVAGRIAGIVTTVAVVGGTYRAADWLLRRTGKSATVLESILAASTLAWRNLMDEVRSVERALESGDFELARRQLARIVGRDTHELNEAEIARAAIETLAESLCDGIVAPLCYLALGGVPLALAYKAVNTLDSMIGHIEPPYRAFGCSAAKLDDAANFVPARASALAIVAAAHCSFGNASQSLGVCRRDAGAHRSPNAGWPEAAIAGALGVRLGGGNSYDGLLVHAPSIGAEFRAPRAADLPCARQIVSLAAALLAMTILALLAVRDALR